MSQEKTVVVKSGVGFCGLLFIVLFCLKVGVVETQVVGWSWWLITAPLWAPTAIALSVFLLVCVVALVALIVTGVVAAVAAIVKSK